MHHDVLIVAIMQHLQGGGKQPPPTPPLPKSMNLLTLPNTPPTKATQKTPE